jgi:hypothetical protein
MIKKTYSLLSLFLLLFGTVQAQSVVVGANAFGGTDAYGPFRVNTVSDTAYSRYAYIYNAQSIVGLEHGDSLTALSFFRNGSDKLRYGPNLRIFVRMSIFTDFGTGALNWTSESTSTGMVKVFDGDPSSVVGEEAGWKQFPFSTPYLVDTSSGKENLEILVEYIQTRKESLIPWVYENNFSVPTFTSNNETKYQSGTGAPPTNVGSSNVRKPYLKIHVPRYDTNLRVNKIYSLGKAPLLMGAHDTIKAWVENEGKLPVYNYPVFLNISGANKHLDTLYIDSLKPYEERLVYFGNHDQMKKSGVENINVHFNADSFPDSDSLIIKRNVSYNVYSHASEFEANGPGGIGFNGQTGDFVAKFYVDTVQYMNQIKVDFSRLNSVYMLGVWAPDSNGRPGKEIYMSDTLSSVLGTNILTVTPKVKIDTSFFVGIRQATNTNVGFTYQDEVPLRPNSFYYTVPAGGTTWVGFNLNTEAFKFNIQPRIQVANDVGILAIRNPNISDTIEYSKDSIAPVVTVINYGYANQNAPFDVVCEVTNEFEQVIYKSTRTIKIKAEDTLQVTFDTALSFIYVRNNTMRVYTKLFNDRVIDNDTLVRRYYVGILHDVYCEGFFSPFDKEEFRLNTDYIKPVGRIVNNGIRDKKNIKLTLQALKDGDPFYTQNTSVDIDAEGSLIQPFDSFVSIVEGTIEIRMFVHGIVDSFPINDTTSVFINVVKSDDIGLLSIIRPKDSVIYPRLDRFTPFVNVRNHGTEDQDSVSIYCNIKDLDGIVYFRDTATKKYTRFSTTQEIFGEFTVPDTNATLIAEFIINNFGDQDLQNDTLYSTFYGKSKYDLGISKVLRPTALEQIPFQSGIYKPIVEIHNYGIQTVVANAWAWVEVKSETGTYYSDSVQMKFAIPTDTSFWLEFNGFKTDQLGKYTMSTWIAVPQDLEQRNDTGKTAFTIDASHSVSIVTSLEPSDSQRYEQNRSLISPKVLIRNTGLEDITSKIEVKMFVTFNKAIVKTETVEIDALRLGRDSILVFKPYTAGLKGEYKFVYSLTNSQDQVHNDDSLEGVYFVDKEKDIKAYQLLFPTVDTVLIAEEPYLLEASFINLGDSDQNTAFLVTMQVFDGGGLIYNSNASLTVDAGDTVNVEFPATFTPDRKTTYDYLVFSRLGNDQQLDNDTIQGEFKAKWSATVTSVNGQNLTVSPNPTKDFLDIEVPFSFVSKPFAVLDVHGRVVKQGVFGGTVTHLDLRELQAGTYFLKAHSSQAEVNIRFILSD